MSAVDGGAEAPIFPGPQVDPLANPPLGGGRASRQVAVVEEIFKKGRPVPCGSRARCGVVEPGRKPGAVLAGEQRLLPELGAHLGPQGAPGQRVHL